LARVNGWWDALTSTMQGLRKLYAHTGRHTEWKRLVEEIVPDFVDPATDLPLPGREEQWGLITEYRMRLAQKARQWDEAERLQHVCVEWDRKNAAPFLSLPPEPLNDSQKNVVRTLAASLHELGEIQRELGQAECVKAYEETVDLTHRISDKAVEASAAFNLGRAYTELHALRDLAQAERWYKRSLDLRDERDRKGRGGGLAQLGLVAYKRFEDARKANAPDDELLKHLNDAVRFYQQALDLLPPNAIDELAVTHNGLGIIYRSASDVDRALHHYNEAIRYSEASNNFFNAASIRRNVAFALMQAGRLSDAREYAYAALRNFEQYGVATAKEQERTRGLIEAMKNDE
jgi:tetratricopeptide (TPR) repeat protein